MAGGRRRDGHRHGRSRPRTRDGRPGRVGGGRDARSGIRPGRRRAGGALRVAPRRASRARPGVVGCRRRPPRPLRAPTRCRAPGRAAVRGRGGEGSRARARESDAGRLPPRRQPQPADAAHADRGGRERAARHPPGRRVRGAGHARDPGRGRAALAPRVAAPHALPPRGAGARGGCRADGDRADRPAHRTRRRGTGRVGRGRGAGAGAGRGRGGGRAGALDAPRQRRAVRTRGADPRPDLAGAARSLAGRPVGGGAGRRIAGRGRCGGLRARRPPAERERIFSRFTRGSTAEDTDGTGLGLDVARGLVVAMGGTIRCEAAPGGGARFVFTLPAEDATVPA